MSPRPTEDTAFDKLLAEGDPLEKIICQDSPSLQLILTPYAKIWGKHIYPRRLGNGAFLQNQWQKFGGHHYTSLVRLHHAVTAKETIRDLCKIDVEADDYESLLKVHAASAMFWDNLGAAIDNFAHAKSEAKKILGIGEPKRKQSGESNIGCDESTTEKLFARTLSSTDNPKLYYAFERRHQFIHSILVPQKITEGMVVFNIHHYDDASTNWAQDQEKFDNIDSSIENDWNDIMTEFASSWHSLHSLLQNHDSDVPLPPANSDLDSSNWLTNGDDENTILSGIGPK